VPRVVARHFGGFAAGAIARQAPRRRDRSAQAGTSDILVAIAAGEASRMSEPGAAPAGRRRFRRKTVGFAPGAVDDDRCDRASTAPRSSDARRQACRSVSRRKA
jgi:hypothetical protein